MASAKRESITGVLGRSPQRAHRGPGAEPLVRVSEGGRRPPEAESILFFTSAN